jgi:hypothetical protein
MVTSARAHGDRFAVLGGRGSLNAMIQDAITAGETSEKLRRKFEARAIAIIKDGAVGFGEMAAEHLSFFSEHPYESAPPDHPLFLLLADIAARLGVPIDLHMEARHAGPAAAATIRIAECVDAEGEHLRADAAARAQSQGEDHVGP